MYIQYYHSTLYSVCYIDVPESGLVVFGCGYSDRIGRFLCNSELIGCIDKCLSKQYFYQSFSEHSIVHTLEEFFTCVAEATYFFIVKLIRK